MNPRRETIRVPPSALFSINSDVCCLRNKEHQQKLYLRWPDKQPGETNGEHNDGKNRTTRPYAPFRLIYSELVHTRIEARKREKYLKSGAGKEVLKQLDPTRSIGRYLHLGWRFINVDRFEPAGRSRLRHFLVSPEAIPAGLNFLST